jgi:hypothetical protein
LLLETINTIATGIHPAASSISLESEIQTMRPFSLTAPLEENPKRILYFYISKALFTVLP